jgi:hypothetical protein
LAIELHADPELLAGKSFGKIVKPLPALGLRLVFEPLLEQSLEAKSLSAVAAGDSIVVVGRIGLVNSQGVPTLVALEGESADLLQSIAPSNE